MRILASFLVFCLLVPFFPAKVDAQILSQPLNIPSTSIAIPTSTPVALSSLSTDIPKGSISDSYILGPGDRLEAHLIARGNALVLDYMFVINPEGKIFFPNVSEIYLSGITLKQARKKIIQAVKKKYREQFSFSLMVAAPKKISVYVTGQVSGPGLRSVYDGTRISDVLKEVGVAKGGSDLSEIIYVKRKTPNGYFKNYKLSLYEIFLQNDGDQNIKLANGDIIAVPAIKSYVYVYGEVARSGTFGYVPGQTLSNYLNLAGGPSARANISGVTVTRQENGKPKVYHVNASDIIQKGMVQKDIEIFPGDVISVPGNFFYFSNFASFANTILLALTLYSTVVR